MGEAAISQLIGELLQTPAGKTLLGNDIDIEEIQSKISALKEEQKKQKKEEENLTKEERKELKRQKREEKKQEKRRVLDSKLIDADLKPEDYETLIGGEIALLKQRLPQNQELRFTGRLFDRTRGLPLQGVEIKLGLSPDFILKSNPNTSLVNLLGDGIEGGLSNTEFDINPDDFLYIPLSGNRIKNSNNTGNNPKTDDKGNFDIKIKIPGYIPYNKKGILDLALLFDKDGFIKGAKTISNGDGTIKQDLAAHSLINIDEAAKKTSQDINDAIDEGNKAVDKIANSGFDLVISARKKSINRINSTIKLRLIPLVVGLLIAFGIDKLSKSNRKVCPTPEELNRVIRRRNKVVKQLNQIFKTILTNTSLSVAFIALAIAIKGIHSLISGLFIPLGAPLGVGIPYSIPSKLENVKDLLKDLEDQNKDLTKTLLISLVFLVASTITVLILLRGIDKMTQECIEENNNFTFEQLEEISQELQDLTQDAEEDGNPAQKYINGFTFNVVEDNSNPTGKLKRRYAVAKNGQGVIMLKGEPSFSANDQILIDELIFYIQSNNLKAN